MTDQQIIDDLTLLRAGDAPTHGGKLLSYVYDAGLAELDQLAQRAAALALPVNGLDPTAFTSVPAMERDLIGFTRTMLHGDRGRGRNRVVGTITSGGTESCMLAVKTARDLWRETHNPSPQHKPRLVAPRTVHAAFHKAAHYFGVELDLVPVDEAGAVRAVDLIERLGPDVALVVVSAPSYPTAQLDPVQEVADAARRQGISCHVDACIGGFVLPWWGNEQPWDFRVPGVTSISADLHKFGYAPKGASVLLQRGRERHRKQFFATSRWPGYPVVNPTMLGSRSATSLAAAWAITKRLGVSGYRDLVAQSREATEQILHEVAEIRGLTVMGAPTGPLFALTTDTSVPERERVDAHHFADEMFTLGFRLQHQPGFAQDGGPRVPHSVHFTVTPVTLAQIPMLLPAMRTAADAVRGRPRANPRFELLGLSALGLRHEHATLSVRGAGALLRMMGIGGASSGLPRRMAPLMRLIEEIPAAVAETLLVEIIARLSEPENAKRT